MPAARFIALIALLTATMILTEAAPLAAEGELARALKSREAFLADAEAQKTRANWLTLIKEFEDAALAQYDPRHASRGRYLGADLALTCGRKFNQEDDFERAEALARRSVLDCPQCTHSAEAQLISGQALVILKRLEQADKQLMKVELNYPGSPQVAEARKLLARIRGGSTPVPDNPGRTAETSAPSKPPAAQSGPAKAQDKPKAQDQPKPKTSQPASAPEAAPPQAPKPRADGLAQVYFVTLHDSKSHSTVTAYLDRVTPYVYNLIPPAKSGGAFRVYADLKGAVIAPKTKLQLSEKTALVQLVKMNQFQNDVVRLVVDLPEAHPYRPTFMDNPPRLVFHVAKESGKLPAPGTEAQPDPPEPAVKTTQAKDTAPKSPPPSPSGGGVPADSMIRMLGLKIKTIVIDPGHGGKDGGAEGYGLKEKDLVLKLARKVAVRIEKRLGLDVHLTRSEDKFITLERRTKIAKDKRADLFISLHVNANNLASVEGFETYVLNFATDRSAMAVAARENAATDKSVSELEDLLHIIAKNTKISESRAMAQALHKSAVTAINKKYKVRDLGVKEAPFYVLVGSDVPSILVEIGFLTNEKDAARLAQDAYLDLIADGLVNGLESYLR